MTVQEKKQSSERVESKSIPLGSVMLVQTLLGAFLLIVLMERSTPLLLTVIVGMFLGALGLLSIQMCTLSMQATETPSRSSEAWKMVLILTIMSIHTCLVLTSLLVFNVTPILSSAVGILLGVFLLAIVWVYCQARRAEMEGNKGDVQQGAEGSPKLQASTKDAEPDTEMWLAAILFPLLEMIKNLSEVDVHVTFKGQQDSPSRYQSVKQQRRWEKKQQHQ